MNHSLFKEGDQKHHSFIVTPADVASFNGTVVHEVCATFTLAREIEYTSRLFVLDMQSADEEGIGTELSITHLAPSFVGECVNIVATLTRLNHEEVLCTYIARVGDRIVAKGSTGQKVFQKDKLHRHFNRFKRNGNDLK
jgi:predicted thioesterase